MTTRRWLAETAAVTAMALVGTATACSSGDEDDVASTTEPTASTTTVNASETSEGLALGDGKVSTGPQKGSLWMCQAPNPNAPGASGPTPWIDGDRWHPDEKPIVQGDVAWPRARFEATTRGSTRLLAGNRLPVDNNTGTFPIASSDPAYAHDRNPNAIAEGDVRIEVPLEPTQAAQPSCVGFGTIGVLVDGSLLFNAVDAQGRDAAAHEETDRCEGHPAPGGIYHHHSIPSCLPPADAPAGQPVLVGYAIDGFGIFVEREADGTLAADDDLDECHGRTSTVPWNGKNTSIYHYVATAEHPYSVGC